MDNSWKKFRNRISGDLPVVGVATIVSNAIGGIFWLYIASILGAEKYGELGYLISFALIASTISLLGASNTIIVYTAKNVKIQSGIFLISSLASGIAAIVLFFILKNWTVSLYVIGFVLFTLSYNELLGRKYFKQYSKFLIIQKILMVGLSIGLYQLMGINGVILGISLSFFPFSYVVYQVFKSTKIDLSLVKSKFGFIVNSYLLELSRMFSGTLDKIIIAPIFGFALLGNYQLGVQVLAILNILPVMFYQYILPQDASGKNIEKLKKIIILISVIVTILTIILAPIILPMVFPEYIEAIEIIQIISLSAIPTSINVVYISKFLGNEESRIVLIGSVIYMAFQLSGIVILGNYFGINGVAFAFVLATTSEAAYLLIMNYIKKKKNDSSDTSSLE